MTDFALVAMELARWPDIGVPIERNTGGRLLVAASGSTGPADLAGLTAQLLLEESSQRAGSTVLRVPKTAPWPDREQWRRVGVDVTLETDSHYSLRARPWRPSWLGHAEGLAPATETLRRQKVRVDGHVRSDPVWMELLNRPAYLSPGQRSALRAAMLMPPGQSLAVVLPTGAGKTFAALGPALLYADDGGTTLLVVPTVALALDQERRAQEVFAHGSTRRFAYHGALDSETKQDIRQSVAAGQFPLVIASPESVVQGLRPALIRCAKRGSLRAIVLDEAHLVSQWGTEFRPDFQALAGIRRMLVAESPPELAPRTLLLSATLTQDAWRTLRTLFGNPELQLVAAPQLRPEPSYWVAKAPDAGAKRAWVLEAIHRAPRPLILYTTLRQDADYWAETIREQGIVRLARVHGSTPAAEREAAIAGWTRGDVDIMVATSAFGLGMDQSNVRTVIHACVPETLDRYYQEVGRAGRDGRACLAVLIHDSKDLDVARSLNQERIVGIEKGLHRWQHMYHAAKKVPRSEDVLVRLDTRPAHVRQDSDANVAWNLRTLILMARAGLISLGAAPPPELQQQEGEADAEYEDRAKRAFQVYTLTSLVSPTGVDHLDPRVWSSTVQQSRTRTLDGDRRSLGQIKSFLKGERLLADLLIEAYSLAVGDRTVRPMREATSCPASRGQGRSPSRRPMVEPSVLVDVIRTVEPRLMAVVADSRPLIVSTPRWDAPAARKRIIRSLRRLVALGIREIRASDAWLGDPEYRALFRAARPKIVFHTPLNESEGSEFMVPRVALAETPAQALDVVADAQSGDRPVELLFIPQDLPDPLRPDRLFLATRNYVELARLATEVD